MTVDHKHFNCFTEQKKTLIRIFLQLYTFENFDHAMSVWTPEFKPTNL